MSIHEHRCCYQDNLWGDALPGQDLRQVWFTGVHSDVGGSYTESEAGLSKITFEWLLMEAVKHGLLVEDTRVQFVLGNATPPAVLPRYVKPDPKAMLHPSLCGYWWLLEYLPRKRDSGGWFLPRGKWFRVIPEGSLIHETVALSGKPVTLPKTYAVEPWVRYPVRVVVEEASFGVTDTISAEAAAPAEPPTVNSLIRR